MSNNLPLKIYCEYIFSIILIATLVLCLPKVQYISHVNKGIKWERFFNFGDEKAIKINFLKKWLKTVDERMM